MDNDVSIDQAFLFDKKMREVGATHALIIKKDGGNIDFAIDDAAVWDFFEKALGE